MTGAPEDDEDDCVVVVGVAEIMLDGEEMPMEEEI